MQGAPPHDLADHNATVARKYNRHMVGHVWDVVRCVYAARAAAARCTPAPPPPRDPQPRADPPPLLPPYNYSAVEEEPLEEVEQPAETQFHNSGVLGMPTRSIYIPPLKYAKLRTDEGECEDAASCLGWVSAASAHYVDVDSAVWTLPEEAFPLRTAPPPAPAPHAHLPHLPHLPAHDDSAQHAGGGGVSPGGSSSPGSGSSSGSGAGASACTAPPNLDHNANTFHGGLAMEEGEAGEAGEAGALSVRVLEARAVLDAAPLLALALRHHADLGDVQTAAVVLIALHEYRSDLFPYIDEGTQEHWLLGYIEFLQRNKLWNVATEVVRCAWVSSVWSSSQQSTGVAACCGRCGRRTRAHQPCDRCAPPHHPRHPHHLPDLCAVCHRVVRGLYAWCQGCSHGGHLQHMRAWMETHQLCPAGCGHHCQLG